MDFPYFYYDLLADQDYRETIEQEVSDHQLETARKVAVPLFNSVEPRNFVDLFRRRELGIAGRHTSNYASSANNTSIESSFYKFNANVKLRKKEDMNIISQERLGDVLLLKGNQKSIIAAYDVENIRENVLSEVFINSESSDSRFEKVMLKGIEDFCVGFNRSDVLLVVSNDFDRHRGQLLICRRPNNQVVAPSRSHALYSAVYSCCSNSFTERFAIGGEKMVLFESASRFLYRRPVRENIYSVHYNQIGNVLYCGTHTGTMFGLDLRQSTITISLKISMFGIHNLLLLPDERYIICQAFNEDLAKVDLRMKKIVCYFQSGIYNPSVKRNPLSVNKSLNVLCSTGLDNITRLWSLENGGYPFMDFSLKEEPHKAWLLDTHGLTELCVFQKEHFYRFSV